jgi:DNA-binding XRE family transcriptional regulator
MKKHCTDKVVKLIWHGNRYEIPKSVFEQYRVGLACSELTTDDVFATLIQETSEPAVLLRGLRTREGMTQVQFAECIGVTQANLSAMENGRRAIGKELARRIEAEFGLNYRLFL